MKNQERNNASIWAIPIISGRQLITNKAMNSYPRVPKLKKKKKIPCTLDDSLPLWQHQKDESTEIETIIHIITNHSQRNQPSAKHTKHNKSKTVFINDQSIHRKTTKEEINSKSKTEI